MTRAKEAGKIIDLMVALRQSLSGLPVTGDPGAKPFLDYDEKYDMAAADLAAPLNAEAVTDGPATACEGGDSNSHGLPHQILSLAGRPKASGRRAEPEGPSATERHAATPIAAESTTKSTTRSKAQREYSPL